MHVCAPRTRAGLLQLADAGISVEMWRHPTCSRGFEHIFLRAVDRPAVPAELLRALPSEEGLRVMKVESHWVTDESIRPGDLLVNGRTRTC